MNAIAWQEVALRQGEMRSTAIIATSVLVLLASACSGGGASTGSSGSPPAGGSTRSSSALAFSACMRSHGVPYFPDPDSNGAIPKEVPQQLGVSSSKLQTAQSACEYLLKPTDAQVQQTLSGMLDFAQCMRSRGVHDWPDPTTEDGEPVFDLRGRLAPDSPEIAHKSDQCANLLYSALGQNGTVLCNGIAEEGCHHYG